MRWRCGWAGLFHLTEGVGNVVRIALHHVHHIAGDVAGFFVFLEVIDILNALRDVFVEAFLQALFGCARIGFGFGLCAEVLYLIAVTFALSFVCG
ncbi:MAG: hypothetical protein ACK5Z2_19315, partial [Bacteroidota bacterium]